MKWVRPYSDVTVALYNNIFSFCCSFISSITPLIKYGSTHQSALLLYRCRECCCNFSSSLFELGRNVPGETPPYHYGTHYSSAMIVASYLIRMEPFTQHFLRLQGGHFDLADRMFHTIKDGYESAAKTTMADVKELIPEFFYLPDFLLNSNKFDLGKNSSLYKCKYYP